jgi:Fe-Mn family superoxide dismutase
LSWVEPSVGFRTPAANPCDEAASIGSVVDEQARDCHLEEIEMSHMGRRQFVSAVGTGAVGVFATGSFAMAAGEPGAAVRPPGKHEVQPLAFAPGALTGISEQVVTWHHDRHYAGYVTNRNLNDTQITKFGPGTPDYNARIYAGIKRDEAWNASGMILHEVYFDNLGGDGKPGQGAMESAIIACFGSLEAWQKDMSELGGQATGWVLACYDPSDGRVHNYLVDQHQFQGVWGAVPVIAMDVFEHAYYHDYGPDRGKYIAAFFQNLHWGRINDRYARARS